jgi:hypothetical protein
VPPVTSMKVPFEVATLVTVPDPPEASSQFGPPPELTVSTCPTEPMPTRESALVPLAVRISQRV